MAPVLQTKEVPMAVKTGRLEPLKLFKVFRGLLERRMSGVLTLRRGQVVKQAQFADGHPVRTASCQLCAMT